MSRIFNMFGPSPIRPIEQHMQKAYHCAKHLYPFFEEVLNKKWKNAEQIQIKIDDLEKKADLIKHELRMNLPQGLFLPFSRTALLELLSSQDKIANKSQDIANLTMSRKMIIPKSFSKKFMQFLERSIETIEHACKATNELDELLETGFKGREVKVVESMILTLDKIEHATHEQLASIQKQIFAEEKNLHPIDVIFLYKLVQWVGDLSDQAHVVGERLQILIAR